MITGKLKISLILLAVINTLGSPVSAQETKATNEIRADVSACTLKNNEREWLGQTLNLWQTVSRDSLRLKPASLPWLVLFNETCVWHVNPNSSILLSKPHGDFNRTKLSVNRKLVDVYGIAHDGNITLPDKQEISPQLTSFVSTYENGKNPFLVFAMPSIWQQAARLKTETNLDRLIRSVFVHEMTHTRHRNFYNRLSKIETRHSFSEAFDDDFIQNRFGKSEDFRAAYESELDLLYRAVDKTGFGRKRDSAKIFPDNIRRRHKQFFTGEDEFFGEVEDIFLTLEGAANWAAYKSALAQGLNESDARKLIRRDGKHWSQDEGLGLFLIIDALLPNWQKKTFGKSMSSVFDLLNKAVNRKYK